MGNTIISSLLFQPPTPPNELDYFGNVNGNATTAAGNDNGSRHNHNNAGNETHRKGQGGTVRGGGGRRGGGGGQQQSATTSSGGQGVVVVANQEPTLHYIWLMSPTCNTPIPALHIKYCCSPAAANSSAHGQQQQEASSSPNHQAAAASSSRTTTRFPSNTTPSTQRYTLLYSHGNAEDIGLLSKFLTDISRLLQVDILVYDYTGYGVGVDKAAVLRFYAVWGGYVDEWKRWRKSGGGDGGLMIERDDGATSGGRGGGGMNGGKRMMMRGGENGVVRYSVDVFMAPMVFPKGTAAAHAAAASCSSSSAAAAAAAAGKERRSSSSTSSLNLPDNVYVGGDELDFIDDDATTLAPPEDHRTTSSGSSDRRDSSLFDDDDDDDDDMPSVTATCYENSTLYGEDDDEDEVSLFTCGASCNEVENSSILVAGSEDYGDKLMNNHETATEFSASTQLSLPSHHHHHQQQQQQQRNTSAGTITSAASSQQHRHTSRRRSSKTPPRTPKQKRRALLRKYKWTIPSPSEEQCYGDILLAYSYLLEIEEIPSKHVLLYGKSVGSGPTCWLAQRSCSQSSNSGNGSGGEAVHEFGTAEGMMYEDVRDDGDVDYRERGGVSGGKDGGGDKISSGSDDDAPGGVVLHSPFLSVIRVVLDMGFTTVGDLFPNIDRVKDFTCPVYIIHGTEDEIVPYYHGEGLYNSLSETSKAVPFWANGAGHNNIEMEKPTAYIKRLMQFIRQCDRLNYPAGALQLSRAFSSGSGNGSGTTTTTSKRGGSSQSRQELDTTCVPNNRKHYTRQMSASKQRKKKGTLVMKYLPETTTAAERRSSSSSNSHPSSTMNTTAPKRRLGGRSYHSNSSSRDMNNNSMEEQQVVSMHDKYHQPQQQYQQDQYPSVMPNLSTDAAMCGIEPSVESKYYSQYLQQQQQQQGYC